MSFLFDKRTKRIVQYVWGGAAIIVIVGMVLLFAPGIVDFLIAQI